MSIIWLSKLANFSIWFYFLDTNNADAPIDRDTMGQEIIGDKKNDESKSGAIDREAMSHDENDQNIPNKRTRYSLPAPFNVRGRLPSLDCDRMNVIHEEQ